MNAPEEMDLQTIYPNRSTLRRAGADQAGAGAGREERRPGNFNGSLHPPDACRLPAHSGL
jgi:hypothetical protein